MGVLASPEAAAVALHDVASAAAAACLVRVLHWGCVGEGDVKFGVRGVVVKSVQLCNTVQTMARTLTLSEMHSFFGTGAATSNCLRRQDGLRGPVGLCGCHPMHATRASWAAVLRVTAAAAAVPAHQQQLPA
jgi:hypothetical protein